MASKLAETHQDGVQVDLIFSIEIELREVHDLSQDVLRQILSWKVVVEKLVDLHANIKGVHLGSAGWESDSAGNLRKVRGLIRLRCDESRTVRKEQCAPRRFITRRITERRFNSLRPKATQPLALITGTDSRLERDQRKYSLF